MFAKETAQLEGELRGLRRILIGIGLVVTALTAGVMVGVVWRGLAPLNRLAGKIAALRTENLSDRIDLPDAPAELAPVVEVSNQLLQRLETAVDRERSFTADVAHELRTPLAGVRSVLEVALSRDRPAQDYQAAMRECLRIAASMQTMTGNLLSLARLDRGQLTVRHEPVPLPALLQECWEPLEGGAKARSLRVSWNGDPAVVMETDRELLRQILTNLLDNAVVYADSGGEIRVDTGLEAGAAFVRIANTGSQVPQDQVERVFERFWRGDASRHGVGRHAGLGLPLARRLATLLGGSLIATSEFGQWFTVTLTLPASNSPPDRPAGTHSLTNAAEE